MTNKYFKLKESGVRGRLLPPSVYELKDRYNTNFDANLLFDCIWRESYRVQAASEISCKDEPDIVTISRLIKVKGPDEVQCDIEVNVEDIERVEFDEGGEQ